MKDAEDFAVFRRRGFVTLPDFVDAEGLVQLKQSANALLRDRPLPQTIMEPDGETVRTIFNVHELDPAIGELVGRGKFVEVAQNLLGEEVYVMQTQLNPKPAFDTVMWSWHSDYLFWHTRDGMAEPRVLTATVYLDDVTDWNGAILAIPGSQAKSIWEVSEAGEALACGVKNANASPSQKAIKDLADEFGLQLLTGTAGSAMFLDSQVLHCSTQNLSPFDRKVLIVRYNSVDNPLPEIDQPRGGWKIRPRP